MKYYSKHNESLFLIAVSVFFLFVTGCSSAVPENKNEETVSSNVFSGEIPSGVVDCEGETVLVSWYIDKNGNGSYTTANGTEYIFNKVKIGTNNGQSGRGHFQLMTVDNSRDLGGYITVDGKTISNHRLLRTGELTKLSDEEAKVLAEEYQVKQIFDLRTETEVISTPDYDFNAAGFEVAYQPVILVQEGKAGDGVVTIVPNAENADVSGDGAVDARETLYYMKNTVELNYSKLVSAGLLDNVDAPAGAAVVFFTLRNLIDGSNPTALSSIAEIFQDLLANEEGSTLWHCSGGVSRTGIITILVMSALGVDRETIVNDFLYSNECNAATLGKLRDLMGTLKLYSDIGETTDAEGNRILTLIPLTEDMEGVQKDEDGKLYRMLSDEEIESAVLVKGVYAETAQLLLDQIDQSFGCFANFWTKGLGLSIEQLESLREMYLY